MDQKHTDYSKGTKLCVFPFKNGQNAVQRYSTLHCGSPTVVMLYWDEVEAYISTDGRKNSLTLLAIPICKHCYAWNEESEILPIFVIHPKEHAAVAISWLTHPLFKAKGNHYLYMHATNHNNIKKRMLNRSKLSHLSVIWHASYVGTSFSPNFQWT